MTVPRIAELMRLVGNPDAYAVQNADGTYTPVRERLTPAVLHDVVFGTRSIGTYIVRGDTARTLVLDVDSGDDAEFEARALATALHELGVPYMNIGIEFSGKKGYHVWVVLPTYVPAHDLRRLGMAAKGLAGVECEVYPKQDSARDLGNLVKLPGSVHQVSGKRAVFVTDFPRPLPVPSFKVILEGVPEIHAGGASAEVKPYICMANIQGGVESGGRNNALFHLAVMLRRNGVEDDHVEYIVRESNRRSKPPLDDWEVDALLVSSQKQTSPMCNSLPDDLKCGESCILNRTPGLYTRPGQVKFATEGEMVVVQVKQRSGKSVVLQHDDTEEIRATVR